MSRPVVTPGDVDYLHALVEIDLAQLTSEVKEAESAGRLGDAMHLKLAESHAFDILQKLEAWEKFMAEHPGAAEGLAPGGDRN